MFLLAWQLIEENEIHQSTAMPIKTSTFPDDRMINRSGLPVITEKRSNVQWRSKDEEVDFRAKPATGSMELMPFHNTADWEQREPAKAKDSTELVLMVGQPVNLVIRIQQNPGAAGRDTMLSSCIAYTDHERDEAEAYDLTDYRGCALDMEIMPDFTAAFNSKTSVKHLQTSFPMFKFPDSDQVHIKCNVLVCKKNCPVAKCDDKEAHHKPQEEFVNVSIIDKFLVGTAVSVVDFLEEDYDDVEEQEERQSQARSRHGEMNNIDNVPRTARYDYRSPLEPIRRPQYHQPPSRKSNYHRSSYGVEDKDFNMLNDQSSEVQKSSIIQSGSNKYINEGKEGGETDTSDLLCLSPARLIMAFGILLVILLLALTASCVLWLRARSALRRPKPTGAILTRAQRHPHHGQHHHHHPGATRIVPAVRPVFVATRTPMPYIRSVQ